MKKLPDNTYLSLEHSTRWSGILNLDGKYTKVRGSDQKIPFIYGIDFLSHDLPVGILVPSENYQAFLKFFRLLKTINYPLRVVVCDDVLAIKSALARYYPQAKIQLCHNHFFENLRNYLNIRTDETYRSFFYDLQGAFSTKLNPHERKAQLAHIAYNSRRLDMLLAIMSNIEKRYQELFNFQNIKDCPNTNNIIEAYNSHLNGRLKTIKGFDSFRSANRWLNAWMIRRRTKNFTDCDVPFKHLNGKCSFSQTLKKDKEWPKILGLKIPKNQPIMKR